MPFALQIDRGKSESDATTDPRVVTTQRELEFIVEVVAGVFPMVVSAADARQARLASGSQLQGQ